MIQGETGRDGGASTGDTDGASAEARVAARVKARLGASDDASAGLASAALLVSLDTSVASRSMVGGSRFGRP